MNKPSTAKIAIQKKAKNKIFSIGMVLPITKKNNSDFFLRAVDAICELGMSISVLAEGDTIAQKKCFEFMQKYPHQFQIFESMPKNRNRIIEESNLLLFPALPNEEMILEIVKGGLVTVMPKNSKLKDYNPQKEEGESFIFDKDNFWQYLTAIIRASENFKFPYDWKNLKKNIEETIL